MFLLLQLGLCKPSLRVIHLHKASSLIKDFLKPLPKLAHVQMTSVGAINQTIPNQGMEERCIDTHVTTSVSLALMRDTYNGLWMKNERNRQLKFSLFLRRRSLKITTSLRTLPPENNVLTFTASDGLSLPVSRKICATTCERFVKRINFNIYQLEICFKIISFFSGVNLLSCFSNYTSLLYDF